MRITIDLPPKPKSRPRLTRYGHAYTPSETRAYEEAVRTICKTKIKSPLKGAVRIDIIFYLPIPKSWSQTKKAKAIDGEIRPTARPDIDNLVKAILDSLNGGIGYNDDSQIVELHVEEWYGEPRTEIELEEL